MKGKISEAHGTGKIPVQGVLPLEHDICESEQPTSYAQLQQAPVGLQRQTDCKQKRKELASIETQQPSMRKRPSAPSSRTYPTIYPLRSPAMHMTQQSADATGTVERQEQVPLQQQQAASQGHTDGQYVWQEPCKILEDDNTHLCTETGMPAQKSARESQWEHEVRAPDGQTWSGKGKGKHNLSATQGQHEKPLPGVRGRTQAEAAGREARVQLPTAVALANEDSQEVQRLQADLNRMAAKAESDQAALQVAYRTSLQSSALILFMDFTDVLILSCAVGVLKGVDFPAHCCALELSAREMMVEHAYMYRLRMQGCAYKEIAQGATCTRERGNCRSKLRI